MSFEHLHNVNDLLPGIRERAVDCDQTGMWPEDDLHALATIGAMRWAVPIDANGEDLSGIELHFRYEAVASASLATALIISQRDSAIGLIDGSDQWPLRRETLARLANNETFTTIGIAQLTTSRQGGPPALRATATSAGYRLDGVIPWSTGAGKSEFVIAGAMLEDGRQILFALPTDLRGARVDPPMNLVALRASWTTQITCDGAVLPRKWMLRDPQERVLSSRKKHLALGQTFLATGLCRGGLELIAEHDSDRARDAHQRLDRQLSSLREEILALSAPGQEQAAADAAPRLRGQCNDLALRMTHTAVTLYKGSALLLDHPAQRLAREAMFLLVWSCPNPVIDCTVDLLSK